jgi:hypothetical protein
VGLPTTSAGARSIAMQRLLQRRRMLCQHGLSL